uniref:Uncharacterized protein n=1 Tax=Palpitomonas bilix TaxID=652834 RepID=A0A7S3D6Q8_9EUKA
MAVKRWMQQNGWKVYLRSEVGGERGDEVEKTRRVSVSGLSESEVGKWGQGKVCLVWDTLGDVDLAYAAANVTIVGGSTRRGAHSPVEAVREGSAVVMGNEVGAAADLSSFFSASHPSSFFACSSTAEVEQRCLSLLLSAHACARWGEEGRTGKAASEGEVEARCEKGGGGQGEKERERAEWMEKRRRDAQSSMKAISHLSLTAAVSHLQQAGVWQEVK